MRPNLEQLVEKYQRNIFAAAYSILQNGEDANDVVQDTFLRYYLHSKQEFESEEHLKAWLLRVAINRATDMSRSFWRRFRMGEEKLNNISVPFDTEDEFFYEAMKALPAKYRIVLHLYYYDEYKTREIAEILKISESAVKMRLSRGRNELRNLLKEE